MGDGINGVAAASRGGSDLGRAVERIAAAVRQDTRQSSRQDWLGKVEDVLRDAQPVIEQLSGGPLDAIALGEARERIAATLARVEALADGIGGGRSDLVEMLDGMSVYTPIPLAPGADQDAVAAAQALARLIAANARPSILVQARLSASAVRSVIGD